MYFFDLKKEDQSLLNKEVVNWVKLFGYMCIVKWGLRVNYKDICEISAEFVVDRIMAPKHVFVQILGTCMFGYVAKGNGGCRWN